MPLLQTPPDGKPWPPASNTLGPESTPQALDDTTPYQQQACYFVPTIQPIMDPETGTPRPASASIVTSASGGRHEIRPIDNAPPYRPPAVLDSYLTSNCPQIDATFKSTQQPSILSHPSLMPIPMQISGPTSSYWPMMLQEAPVPSNLGHMAERASLQPHPLAGSGAYAGPATFSVGQPPNMFPVAIPGNEFQYIQAPQSVQPAASAHYSTAIGPTIPSYTGPTHLGFPTVSNQSSEYTKLFMLQSSLKHASPRQEPTGPKSDQGIAETDDTGTSPTQNDFPLGIKSPPDHSYAQARSWKSVAEDELSDLNNMTQAWLRSHIAGFDDVLQHIPLEELGKQALIIREPSLLPQGKGCSWNLVKIENIPYNLDDDMLFEFLGKTPGLVPEEHGGIHIIMDRTTGKTMDCFLEFPTVGAAERFIQRRCNNNRRCILGGRHISLELVRQGELMRWLFPKVRGATWGDNGGLVLGDWTALSATVEIISREELVMILGHARTPHRSPFSRKCLQRPYESLMSVVTKFPWKETDDYTLKQRDLIFQAAFEAGELLKRQILRGKAGPNIDLRLLRRLCRTISFCPGFTYRQKLTFLDAMGITTTECFTILGDLGISHPLATQFQALTVRPGADYVAVEAIANLVADGVSRGSGIRSESDLDARSGVEASNQDGSCCELTMRAAATIELEAVIAAIKATFASGGGMNGPGRV
ncbi:hypothetical protein TWF481_000864 [Arthrobotrys musiformis]|uniref:RRM domain-containing protein n=1 Tax=Arthrobotrys musiformis TaxID=47236 RepID=A0AAV9WNU2_9PEZI